ncbi:MAG TPA: protein translocase subunit SecD [Planctomycetota bacterium]|nr:protein translocase subunit SecD [Planctomycetota bacterium]
MQSTLSSRFTVTMAAVLGTTVLPWLVWGKALEKPYEMKMGLDLKGGASITYRVPATEGMDQAEILKEAIRITRFRVDRLGVSEVDIKESGTDQYTVELPGRGKEEIDRIKEIMGTVGSLEFRIVADAQTTQNQRAERDRKAAAKEPYQPARGYQWYPGDDGQEYLLEVDDIAAENDWKAAAAKLDQARKDGKPAADITALEAEAANAKRVFEDLARLERWTGQHLQSVSAAKSMDGPGFEVLFSITAERASAFGEFTGGNLRRQMAIVLNGSVNTAPVIESKLPGSGKISSRADPYTQETAQALVTVLQSGSVPVKPQEISSFVVGPGLGEDAVRRGRWSVLISAVLVIAFMAIFYYGAGWVANLAVVLNLVMTAGILMFLEAALTLPGIAGLILTLGMAVDANILVNERIREEKEAGKGLAQAIAAGYDRAWITILDSNLTTILAGVVLYWVGTGPIRGFALTLIIGLLISMFTACYVTRTIFVWGLEVGILKEFRMMPVLRVPSYRYTGARAKTMGISAILIVLGTLAFVARERHDKYDLEFNGGERIIVALRKPMAIAALRDRLDASVPAAFARETAAAGEPATLGPLTLRTIRARGTDAESLDLAVQSDRFEVTAQVLSAAEGRSERLGRMFAEQVSAALKDELLPTAIPEITLAAPETGKADRAFTAKVNLLGGTGDAAAVKTALASSATLLPAGEVKVEAAADADAGVSSFVASGGSGAASEAALREDLLRSLRRAPGIEVSEPIPQSDYIGPGVAQRLREQAIIAVLLSTLFQIVYLRFRFRDFTYGFAAAIIVAHNVLITLGLMTAADALGLVHAKISLPVIASFLTLIGYSVNDTIVVFDRIRENLGRSTHPTAGLIDRAISDTLARSIRTSITVFFVALTLLVANLGGTSSIEGFSFVMVVGVLTSAYASVFISSPLLLFLPVYGRALQRLGRPAVLGLIAALFVGLGVAFTQDGVGAIVGGVFAALLPLHFLGQLIGWFRHPDPDLLLRKLEKGEDPGLVPVPAA